MADTTTARTPLALHDWIPHAVDANERYRTFGRPSVFSHDRLMYTIANHTDELRTKEICNAVSMELRRLMGEELLLRTKLIRSGIRDVSKEVELPPNRLDQLDEESADYDDKRLCHSCKHICFFSAVACECSESKVSCLRHSHYMCRCTVKRKYLLIWTSEQEMKDTISRVEKRGEELEYANPDAASPDVLSSPKAGSKGRVEDAPGADKDRVNHCTFEVPVEPICKYEPEVPTLVSSDVSCSSAGSRDGAFVMDEGLQPMQQQSSSANMQQTTNNISMADDFLVDSGNLSHQPIASTTAKPQKVDVIFKPSDLSSSENIGGDNENTDDFSA